jgi:hypothetical protein
MVSREAARVIARPKDQLIRLRDDHQFVIAFHTAGPSAQARWRQTVFFFAASGTPLSGGIFQLARRLRRRLLGVK